MARLLGMTAGATMTALVFHFVPERAEPVSLAIATGVRDRGGRGQPPPPLAAGIAGLRLGAKITPSACWQGR